MHRVRTITLAPLAAGLLLGALASSASAQYLTAVDMTGKRITTTSRSYAGAGFAMKIDQRSEVNGRSLERILVLEAFANRGSNVRAIYTSDANGRPGPAVFTIPTGTPAGMHSRVHWSIVSSPNTRVRVKGPGQGDYLYGVSGPWTIEIEGFLHRPHASSPDQRFGVSFSHDILRIGIRRAVGRSCGSVDLTSTGTPERPRLSIAGLSASQLAVMLWVPDRAYFRSLDLSGLGAPACILELDPLSIVALPMARAGSTASIDVHRVGPSLAHTGQGLVFDPQANAAGFFLTRAFEHETYFD